MSIKDYVKLKQTEHNNVAQAFLNHLSAMSKTDQQSKSGFNMSAEVT